MSKLCLTDEEPYSTCWFFYSTPSLTPPVGNLPLAPTLCPKCSEAYNRIQCNESAISNVHFFFFLVFLLKFLCLLTLYLLGSIPSTYYPTHIPKCSSPLYDKWSDWSLPLYSYQLNFWVRNAINLIISVTRRVSLAGTSTCQFQNPLQTYSLALYTSVAFILQASPLLLPFPTNLLLSCVVSLVLCQSPSSLSYLNSFLFSTCS